MKMRRRTVLVGFVVLAAIGGLAFMLPGGRGYRSANGPTRFTHIVEPFSALGRLTDRLAACDLRWQANSAMNESATSRGADRCAGVIYVWSRLMPLSRSGIPHIAAAADSLDLKLTILSDTELLAIADVEAQPWPAESSETSADGVARALIAGGATVHYPTTTVYAHGRFVGATIAGYKTAAAYRSMIAERLDSFVGGSSVGESPASAKIPFVAHEGRRHDRAQNTAFRDFQVPGRPSAYFRWNPRYDVIAFESGGSVYLLDPADGRTTRAPGFIDFVPSPDGILFVTPGRNRRGLEFYDAAEVVDAASDGMGADVQPIFIDPLMTDQYPSVGKLDPSVPDGTAGGRVTYRVLTSWFDRIVFRDYTVDTLGSSDRLRVRPVGEPTRGCANLRVSLPIMSPDGGELAARDEMTGTTRIFAMDGNGRCSLVLELGLQTGKVAWHADGRRIAFAVPRGAESPGSGRALIDANNRDLLAGIFVFDREEGAITRVAGSESVDRLAFPEFVGRDSVLFLLAGSFSEQSRFRLVPCGC